jgi:hypothetical protein
LVAFSAHVACAGGFGGDQRARVVQVPGGYCPSAFANASIA